MLVTRVTRAAVTLTLLSRVNTEARPGSVEVTIPRYEINFVPTLDDISLGASVLVICDDFVNWKIVWAELLERFTGFKFVIVRY